MKRKLGAALAALTLAFTSVAAAPAAYADDHRGRHERWDRDGRGDRDWDRRGDWGRRDYDRGRRHYRDNDNDDAIVAGVVGLALGAVIGSALSQPQQPAYAPPPQRYYDDGYYEDRERTCYRRERQWDRYAERYVTVDVPYSC